MKRITIKSVAVLLVIGLSACSALRTGSTQGEKDSAEKDSAEKVSAEKVSAEKVSSGGLNVPQGANQPAPGAQNVNQRATDTRVAKQQSNGAKPTGAIGATRRIKFAKKRVKSSMAKMRWGVKKQVEFVELQIIETQYVAPVAIDVIQPAEVIEAQPVQVIGQPVAPAVIVDMNETIVMPQARSVYVASPVSPECYTGYETWVEFRDP